MTVKETGAVMDILSAAYPQFYAGRSAESVTTAVKLWSSMFEDDDVRVVVAALRALISTKVDSYPPSIGAVKEEIRKLRAGYGQAELDEYGAWSLVSRAIRNGIHGAQAEFEKLPESVRRCVGSPSQLREWALMDAEVVGSVVMSQFVRVYRSRLSAAKDYEKLPESVRSMAARLAGTAGAAAIGDGKNGGG